MRARTFTDPYFHRPPPSPSSVLVAPNIPNRFAVEHCSESPPTPTLLGRVGRAVTMDISEMPSRRTAQATFMQGYQPRNVVLSHVADTSSSLAMRRGLSFSANNRRPVAISVASDLSMDLGTSQASSGGSAMSISPPHRSSMQLCAKNVLGGVDLGAAESTGVGGQGGLSASAPLRIRKVLKQEIGECPASPSFLGGNPWGAKDKCVSRSGLSHQEFLGSLAVGMGGTCSEDTSSVSSFPSPPVALP